MGNLVIVESPAKAKTIQKYLGDGYTVKSSFGHIRDLEENNLSIDVASGFKPQYIVPEGKKKVVADLKKAAAAADIIWLASDEDREGEAISWHLAQTLELDPAKTRRIAFHEITKNAIQEAIKNPRDIDVNLVNAQQARRVLDRLVGFELSPVLWRKIRRGLSAGRVQSVALRLVVDREKEIMEFRSEPFYRVEGTFHPQGAASGVKVKAVLDSKFGSKEEAEKFLQDSIGSTFSVASVDSKEGSRYPAPPFTTSTLQQEAARKLHLPVGVTMRLAQSLYERGLITYMRTDSTNLSSLALNTSKQFILDNFGPEYSHPRQFKTHSKGAQEAHEAIRPTFIENTTIEGTAQEQKLYNLIWKRTVASQMADAKVLNTSIKLESSNRPEKFNIQASQILFDGFLKLYNGDKDDDSPEEVVLPEVRIGDIMDRLTISAECKYTQPPVRYSEGTLVKKLEELGIGRPSTYAPTITTLTTGRGYIVKGDKEGAKMPVTNLTLKGNAISASSKTETIGTEKGKLLPQEVGMIVTDYLVANFKDILDYDFTANVEQDFDIIAEGGKVWNEVISEFYSPFHSSVQNAIDDRQFNKVSREIGIDPADGKMITARFGQYGAYVQKGEGDDRQFASLSKGQLIENLTLEDAIKLLQLPRTIGQYQGIDIVATKGRFGPYLKFGERNISLPKSADPLKVTIEECIKLIDESASATPAKLEIATFGDIQVLNGRYGPYIKCAGSNYKIPKGTNPESLTEEACREIINGTKPTAKTYKKSKKTK